MAVSDSGSILMRTFTVMRSSSWVAGSCKRHKVGFAQDFVLQFCNNARGENIACRYQPSFPAPDIASLASIVRFKPSISDSHSIVSHDGLESTHDAHESGVGRVNTMHCT